MHNCEKFLLDSAQMAGVENCMVNLANEIEIKS